MEVKQLLGVVACRGIGGRVSGSSAPPAAERHVRWAATMQAESALGIIAEVSVALAGFTGVVAVFGSREQSAWNPVEVMRFRTMLISSLAALLFSIIPICLYHLGISETQVWSTSSTLLAMFLTINTVRVVRTIHSRDSLDYSDVSPWPTRIMAIVLTGAVALLILNILGVGFNREFGPYFVGLVALVLLCVITFVRMLSFVGHPRDLPTAAQQADEAHVE